MPLHGPLHRRLVRTIPDHRTVIRCLAARHRAHDAPHRSHAGPRPSPVAPHRDHAALPPEAPPASTDAMPGRNVAATRRSASLPCTSMCRAHRTATARWCIAPLPRRSPAMPGRLIASTGTFAGVPARVARVPVCFPELASSSPSRQRPAAPPCRHAPSRGRRDPVPGRAHPTPCPAAPSSPRDASTPCRAAPSRCRRLRSPANPSPTGGPMTR